LDSPQIRERADAQLSQLEPLSNEISLLAPDVATKFEVESRSELDLALAGLFNEDELISDRAATVRWLAKFNSTTCEIEKAMRRSLGIEDREFRRD
jgi:Zn-dependent M32 family carboxypeptidase